MKNLIAIPVFLLAFLMGCEVEDTGTAADEGGKSDTSSKADAPKKEKKEKSEPEMTAGQSNAVRSAEDYLDFGAFSRSGLIEQLEFEGYKTKDATWAVDYLKVDWNKQAEKSAKDYLEMSGFSRSGLIEQLMFEGFTRKQAEYGVNKAGL